MKQHLFVTSTGTRFTPRFTLAALSLFAAVTAFDLSAADKPNLIVIMADDMGYGDASCYGGSRFRTPGLDQMAAEGMRFTDFHSSGAVCSPTRAGLLTGRYQQRAGIPGVVFADPERGWRHRGLQVSETTFAEQLHDTGYVTAMFGKWHLGYLPRYNPVQHGFDEFRGYVSGNVDYFSHIDQAGFSDWWHNAELSDEPGYSTHLISQHAVRFIKANRSQPFCLYVAHEAPHYPYQGPNDKPIRKVGNARNRDEAADNIPAAYAAMMTAMDEGVASILDTVRSSGIAERTFVFFLSDNGGTKHGSNGSLKGFKGSVWEGGHRVPAIGWWPQTIPGGSTTDVTAISLDVMPTLLDIADVAPGGPALDGHSLLPVLTDQEPELQDRSLFWEHGTQYAVRSGNWKLIVDGKTGSKNKPPQLYRLDTDLPEQHDLAETQPERVRAMCSELERWKIDVSTGATKQPDA